MQALRVGLILAVGLWKLNALPGFAGPDSRGRLSPHEPSL